MKHINIFGGPGTGKSTTSAGLFYKMKKAGYKTELTQEYAKDLTYQQNTVGLADQFLVTATQHHKGFILKDHVDYAIHDSPLLIGVVYSQYEDELNTAYEEFITKLFNSYSNINIFLTRVIEDHPYHEYGRSQSLNQAIELDIKIKNLLLKHSVPFIEISVKDAANKIFKLIVQDKKKQNKKG